MSVNLLELINENVSSEVISSLSNFLGESPKNTTNALSNAIPSILAGLVSKSADGDGASSIFNLLRQGNHDGSILNNLAGVFGGGESTNSLLSSGASLLTSVFGQKAESITNLVANASGISKSSSNSLLGLLGPMIFGVLGKVVNSQGITSAAGLASLLASQSGFLKNFLPAGLGSILGMANLGDLGKVPAAAALPVEEDSEGGFGKFLPWLLLPAILALGWGLLNYFKLPKANLPETNMSQSVTPEAVTPPTTVPTEATPPPMSVPTIAETTTPVPTEVTPAPVVEAPKVETAVTEVKTAVDTAAATVGSFFEKTLSSGFAIKAAPDGIESKLVGFLEDAGRVVDKKTWFTMNGIQFDTAKATIKAESNAQITNIAEIMKAYPTVKIKIGGYTDNKGKAKSNMTLSASRAKAVREALAKAGIDATRIAAEGYGAAHPVATNDTEEGRQQNRRIDVLVTAK